MRQECRHFTAKEKVEILRRHLQEHVPVSELCEQYGLHPTLFYRRQKEFFVNGVAAFAPNDQDKCSQRLEKEKVALQSKLTHKDEVIAKIMEAHF